MASTGTTIQKEIERLKKAKNDFKTVINKHMGVIPEEASLSVIPQILDRCLSDDSGLTLTIVNICYVDGDFLSLPYALCIDLFSEAHDVKLCIKDVADDTNGAVFFQTDSKKIGSFSDPIYFSTEILNNSSAPDSDFWSDWGTNCSLYMCCGDEEGYHDTNFSQKTLDEFREWTDVYGDKRFVLDTHYGKDFHKIMIMVIWTMH